jgi:hypothetical protein
VLRALLPSFLLALAFPVWAALGDNTMSVQNDQARMKGTLRSVAGERFVMHEIRTPAGHAVREYVSPQGTVFGIAWEGPSVPDLQQVLGPYFDTMKQAAAQKSSRGPLIIDDGKFVFVQAGHMRAFRGSAYLSQELPQGVSATDIK